ncbi:hypothetical protein GQ53DRAFT_379627 [Thozetella sp. PMI_491]|nr:hypothetical protein GQ53DRAFT_379627 [Thozetella sp. PMI_491]
MTPRRLRYGCWRLMLSLGWWGSEASKAVPSGGATSLAVSTWICWCFSLPSLDHLPNRPNRVGPGWRDWPGLPCFLPRPVSPGGVRPLSSLSPLFASRCLPSPATTHTHAQARALAMVGAPETKESGEGSLQKKDVGVRRGLAWRLHATNPGSPPAKCLVFYFSLGFLYQHLLSKA